jgi:uncharacterized protein (DUF1501 family)
MSQPVSRRDLLKWASAGAGAAAVGGGAWLIGRNEQPNAVAARPGKTQSSAPNTAAPSNTTGATDPASTDPTATNPTPPPAAITANADLSKRLLVVVEMSGGNDGLSMTVPYGMGSYYDLRQNTGIAAEDVLSIDNELGYAKNMVNIHRRGAAIVQGVGSFQPDGSHFEMQSRWSRGDPDGSQRYDTGFFGRLADAIGDPSAAAVAVSTRGGGVHPSISSKKVGAVGLSSLGASRYLTGANQDDPNRLAFQNGMAAFARSGGEGFAAQIRDVNGRAITFAESVSEMVDDSGLRPDYPDNEFTRGLSLAMSLFLVDHGVRIVHVQMDGDFDTHDDHLSRHAELMARMDEGLNVFMDDLANNGIADRVLVMTTSEFGRRIGDSGSSGLDHGTASTALLMGPVNAGRYGEMPSFTDLADDNLKATVGMDQYYGTVAENWFGVPASDLFAGSVETLQGIIA